MASFGILRTNVGLTTNVKIMVDSKYDLSLDSIDSIEELSYSKYKKMSFNKENYYDEVVPYFFKDLPTEISYHIKYDDDNDSMSSDFSSQYDELYQYGARNIIDNKNYKEEFEYFAPLYIHKGNLPKNFVIFRVDGPGLSEVNRLNIKKDIFNKFKTVKVYDLTKKTSLGEWLDRNFVKNDFFPESVFDMNFTKLEFSHWNGIDYKTGGYVSKSLFLDDVLEKEKEIFELEKFIFDGYKNNNVIFSSILNLSFLFDDTPATSESFRKWSLNRYYGFYLDDMELISNISPYITPIIKNDSIVKENNILYSESGCPFIDGWVDSKKYYVEYNGSYYNVEPFDETVENSIKPVTSSSRVGGISTTVKVSGNVITDELTTTIIKKWRIISTINLEGKESLLNKNSGYIDSNKSLLKYDKTPFLIKNFDLSDIWLIEIDGLYHNLIKDGDYIKVHSDYSFKFIDNDYSYWINKNDPSYTKSISFKVDSDNKPKVFNIFRLKLSDIKDFDDKIVDTEYSKYEYEKESDLSYTDETKMYLTNLNSNTNPKELDDFIYKEKVSHIPVSSEYTANNETFKISENELSQIWRKNPVYCRWSFENSISGNDYPYILNNSLQFEDYNRSVNPFDPDPSRIERNLDYFYSINSSTFSYFHHTLHIENNNDSGIDYNFKFDFDKYLGIDTYTLGTQSIVYDLDYFSYFFNRKTSFLSNVFNKSVRKYSLFNIGDFNTPNITLFRGIKFLMNDVKNIKKDSNGQIETINIKTSNAFESYKLSILLTGDDNGMEWDIIEEWRMDQDYKKGSIVIHDDILYITSVDTITLSPIFVSNNKQVKSAPYNQSDWSFYNDTVSSNQSPFWTPTATTYNSSSIIYSNGDYYKYEKSTNIIDFWNPSTVYTNGYLEGAKVIYKGSYYQSLTSSNIYTPDFKQDYRTSGSYTENTISGDLVSSESFIGEKWSKYWEKIEIDESSNLSRWKHIGVWNPSFTYTNSEYVVHENIVYLGTSSNSILNNEVPGISLSWKRIYSLVADTNYVYKSDSNQFIYMNNHYYRITNNPYNKTLENGINIFINKKHKNILINIFINDNTISNLSNMDRDSLYTSLNKKLTAHNFIESINDISSKNDFSDYLSYTVIDENGIIKKYNYDNILDLPYILTAEKPTELLISVDSLITKPIDVSKLKAARSLKNGKISNISELNYFNDTHIANEITHNDNEPLVVKNYHGVTNVTDDTIYRFSGSYMPLFYNVELFKSDNTISYNNIDIILEMDEERNIDFNFQNNLISSNSTHKLKVGASYSNLTSYYNQIQSIILGESILSEVDFIFEIYKNKYIYSKDELTLRLESNSYNDNYIWVDLSGGVRNGILIGESKYVASEIYPGGYMNFGSTGSKITTDVIEYDKNTTWEAWVRCSSDVNGVNTFMGTDITNFSFVGGNSICFYNNIGGVTYSLTTDSNLDLNTWYYVASSTNYVGVNTISKLYINGDEKVIGTFSGYQDIDGSTKFTIGDTYLSSFPFFGDVTNVRIYDRTLTSTEINNNFINQHDILSVKYEDSVDIKITLTESLPILDIDITNVPSDTTLIFTMGATGGNPPYTWSFNGDAFSATASYVSDKIITQYNIVVKDSIGLTSNSGYYSVNTIGETSVNGTFNYIG